MSKFVLPFRVMGHGETYTVETRDELQAFVSYMQETLEWLDREPVMPAIARSSSPPVVPTVPRSYLFSPAQLRIIQMLSENVPIKQIGKTERVCITAVYNELRHALKSIGFGGVRFGPVATKILADAAKQQSVLADWEALARERMAAAEKGEGVK